MGRPHRLEVPGGLFHIYLRGNEKASIFRTVQDRYEFLDCLADVAEAFAWEVLAYCLMTNHYHLLVRVEGRTLARGMHLLNGRYARYTRREWGVPGHLFERRYNAILVQSGDYARYLTAYIERNPVRAGLCSTSSEWPWSSYRTVIGSHTSSAVNVAATLRLFDDDPVLARRLYEQYVADPRCDVEPRPLHRCLGSEDFVKTHREDPAASTMDRPPLDQLLTAGGRGDEIAHAALVHGYALAEIGRHLGLATSTISRRLAKFRRQGRQAGRNDAMPGT